jgi:hypothetical protein
VKPHNIKPLRLPLISNNLAPPPLIIALIIKPLRHSISLLKLSIPVPLDEQLRVHLILIHKIEVKRQEGGGRLILQLVGRGFFFDAFEGAQERGGDWFLGGLLVEVLPGHPHGLVAPHVAGGGVFGADDVAGRLA